MYKVLIADDEKIIRIALKSMISWEDLGFSADYAAEDGLSALQIVKEHCPDLVIIDIMMPGMNGIDFVKQARQDGYTGEIVILSNHQNFNYAVEALRNRVSDYILKTDITPQSLTQCLLKVKKKLDASAPAMEQAPEAVPKADADRDIALLQDALKPGAAAENVPLSGSYAFLNVFTKKSLTEDTAGNNMAANALKNLTSEHLRGYGFPILELSDDSLLILLPRKDVNSLTSGPEFTQRLQKLVHLYLNTDCGFILSGLFSSCSQFLHMVSLLPEAGQLILYHGFGAIIDENEYTGFIDKPLNPAPLIQKLRQYIDQDDFAGCRTALKRLTAQLASRKYHPRQTVLLLKKTFAFFLLYETIRLSCDPEKTAETRREFLHCCTLKEYLDCFGRLFDLLALSPLTLKISDSSCRREVLLICDYIEKNIDHRITLSMLSENVNMSENYISRLFKAETGNNIVNYINQLKMNHARPLLEDKNLSVRDVALALGFDEPSYFNKLFFRFFGLSPTGYRKAVTEILNAE